MCSMHLNGEILKFPDEHFLRKQFLTMPPNPKIRVFVLHEGAQDGDIPWMFELARKEGVRFRDLIDRFKTSATSGKSNAGRLVVREMVVKIPCMVMKDKKAKAKTTLTDGNNKTETKSDCLT